MAIMLRVTTEVLKDQSNQVRSDVQNIQRRWQNIQKLINGTRSYWEGEASDAHIKVYRDVEDDVTKIIQRLAENPVKLQQMAGIYDADEAKAAQTANSLPTEVF
jgi:WXG100 family type VII secretion target